MSRKIYFHLANRYYIMRCLLAILIISGLNNTGYVYGNEWDDIETKNVLYISSYSPRFMTFFQQVEGINSEFSDQNINLDIEFMDTKRLSTDENIQNFYENIKFKLAHLPEYDAVIVADDNALLFIEAYQNELFADIPIVFMGINNREYAMNISQDPFITGVIEYTSIDETIDMALRLNSRAKNVVAIVDNTTSGQGDLVVFHAAENNFENLNFSTIDLSYLDFDEFTQELEKLNHEDIVLLLSAYSDETNEKVSFDEGLSLIVEHCNQPVYHPYYHGIGEGIIGGKTVSHYNQGVMAASVVNGIFSGTDISEIDIIIEGANQWVFDYAILESYHMDVSRLPQDTIFINKKTSIISEYLGIIVGIILFILMELLIIVLLMMNINKRNAAEKGLVESQGSLQLANEELLQQNEELQAAFNEITQQDLRIKELVYNDELTGLNNRLSFFRKMGHAIKKNKSTVIMFMDVDDFKYINDTFGHDVGDEVLVEIGNRLKAFESKDITVARFGGDEFLLMIEDVSDKAIINNCIEELKKNLSVEVLVGSRTLFVTVSIGITLFPENGDSLQNLIKNADLALYKAKAYGKNRYTYYDASMEMEMRDKIELQGAIKKALENEELYLNYQPYVDANTEEVLGVEALIRWDRQGQNYISPYNLIKNLEEMGLMVKVGEWILRKACTFAKDINEDKNHKITVAINISPTQIMHHDFYQDVIDIVEEIDVDPRLICLEMTETILLKSIEKGISVFQMFKDKGFGIALDDFGTGYSSLGYFKDLPITKIKIDKCFVDNVVTSSYDKNLINLIITISHGMGVAVIAEGVETTAQLEQLKAYNCDCIQGYLFSKALSPEKLFEYIDG